MTCKVKGRDAYRITANISPELNAALIKLQNQRRALLFSPEENNYVNGDSWHVNRALKLYLQMIEKQPKGCACPVEAENTCRNPLCPRQDNLVSVSNERRR